MRGSIADFTLDRLLAIRLSDEEEPGEGERPAATPATARSRGPLPTEWAAPSLPAGI